jgi:tetratricopeptide (TPR) repeat protein
MTLPVILILLDVYPFRHLDTRLRTWRNSALWGERVPYLVLGAVAATLGYWAQAANKFITPLEQITLLERIALVAHSLWFYASKTVLPLHLSPLYELPELIDPLESRFLLPLVTAVVLTATFLALRRRWPAGLAVWAAYVILLSPVIGVVHSGHQLTHDRYSYLSTLGWALLLGAGVTLLRRVAMRRLAAPAILAVAGAAMAFWFVTLGVLTSYQVAVWRDTESLWRHAVDSSPKCSVCEGNTGVVHLNANRFDLARDHFERALDTRSDRVMVHHNIGLILARTGDIEGATERFRRVVDRRPDEAAALMNLGVSLMKQGRHADALVYLERAATVTPNDYLTIANLGLALIETRRAADAVTVLKRAVERDPTGAAARYALVAAHLALGQADAATREHRFLRAVDPAAAHFIGPLLLSEW